MSSQIRVSSRQAVLSEDLRIHYLEAEPTGECKGILLLIHGFPQSSYQFRFVLEPFAAAGYRVIAPDFTGHGSSSKPLRDVAGFSKKQLAQDLYNFLSHLLIITPIHIVGHDIGGMIAFAFVMQYPEYVSSVVWGECPLPGTIEYERFKHDREHWHFAFQGQQPDMAAALVAGKEKIYVKQFYDRFAYNHSVFGNDVIDYYASQYAMPGALRCAFYVYSAFEMDAAQNRAWISGRAKVRKRNLILTGAKHALALDAESMASEVFENVKARYVADSGHYIAEENPEDFVAQILEFLKTG
ncbi:Alpha/Beta hydrolase protein [Aspergillus minisclerotigenes]|uniref:Alpha/Beta hydrolase protein n=1 Tax=Aspergillus minisclerotigenes TaxID=656917 RepID=A0A5N6ISS8_9EURO|nr:Alpha/Beta hydrolase protein [Aspergillus minisclerotigenes]